MRLFDVGNESCIFINLRDLIIEEFYWFYLVVVRVNGLKLCLVVNVKC